MHSSSFRLLAFFLVMAAVIGPAALGPAPAVAQNLDVAEVGSFHVGGRAVSLTGLPTRDIVFTAGPAPIKVDPNGDFEVEQMYVQYVRLAQPKLLWENAARCYRRYMGSPRAAEAAPVPAR